MTFIWHMQFICMLYNLGTDGNDYLGDVLAIDSTSSSIINTQVK